MRHLKKRFRIGGFASHNRAVFINLCKSIIKHGRIKTTKAKARIVRPMIEKLVTKAKNNTLHSKRVVSRKLKSWDSIPKLFDEISPKFKDRPGGYTRIINIGYRNTDGAEIAILEFIEEFGQKKIKDSGKDKKAESTKPAKDDKSKAKVKAKVSKEDKIKDKKTDKKKSK